MKPNAVEREVEDVEALIREAGGSAYVYGISSGAARALEAAQRLPSIPKLALYEAPFIVDNSRSPILEDYLRQLQSLLDSDMRGAAVKLFMEGVGVPTIFLTMIRSCPPGRS